MDHRIELIDVIRSVRNRWRLRLAMRGAVIVAAGTILALLLSASGLESFRFSAPAIIAFRILSVAVFVALAALIVAFGPVYLRHGLSALLVISRSAEAASPYRIDVAPGNAKVP